MSNETQPAKAFNTNAQQVKQPVIYADNAFEFKGLTEFVKRTNESTGGNTVVKMREQTFVCGIH